MSEINSCPVELSTKKFCNLGTWCVTTLFAHAFPFHVIWLNYHNTYLGEVTGIEYVLKNFLGL